MSLYEPLLRHVLWPFYESVLRGRGTPRYMRQYQRDQWLSPDALRDLQFQRFRALVAWCYREVPYYGQRWRAMGIEPGDLRAPGDEQLLPVLTKADIRQHAADLVAVPLKHALGYKSTGGSTGEPLRFGFTRESNDRRTAVMWRGYSWAGSRMGRRTAFLWAGTLGSPPARQRWKDRAYNAVLGRHMLDSFQMSDARLEAYADALARYRPEVVVGYVGPLVRLSQWMADHGRRIPSVRSVIGAAEALHPFQKQVIERAFGAPAFNTYGCREFMLIASECEHRQGLHVNADHLLVETLDRSGRAVSGQSGEVAVTDLYNRGMPFVRYVNGDMATASVRTCACGRGLPLLDSVDGRTLDAIRTPAGHVLPGEFFPHMLKDVPGVARFQLVQRALDRLDLSIVRGDAFDEASLAHIRREVARVLGESARLECHFVDDIPLTASGKLRVTISELAP
jgi:phenylacetate-CoA ligase